jgi:hypothetical protein
MSKVKIIGFILGIILFVSGIGIALINDKPCSACEYGDGGKILPRLVQNIS